VNRVNRKEQSGDKAAQKTIHKHARSKKNGNGAKYMNENIGEVISEGLPTPDGSIQQK
jgi:hypothetical protein